jgi:hypothetical protein
MGLGFTLNPKPTPGKTYLALQLCSVLCPPAALGLNSSTGEPLDRNKAARATLRAFNNSAGRDGCYYTNTPADLPLHPPPLPTTHPTCSSVPCCTRLLVSTAARASP